MPASPLGKIKMVAQVVSILALILGKDHLQGFFVIGQIALWVVVVTSLVSAADYFRRFGVFLNPKVVALPTAPPKAHAGRKVG
jgi:phosphatidylglycerophosphate synthase